MSLFPVYPLFDVTPISAQGAWLTDVKGERYLDFYGGHAVISIGHGHPHYVKRLKDQMDRISFYSNSVPIPIQTELDHKLGQLSGYTDYQLFLCNSGAEANENAFKVASHVNGRRKILAFEKAFHGRTSLAVAATDNAKLVFPVNEGAEIIRCSLGDQEEVARHLNTGEVCCVIIEGIQGVGGIVESDTSFLQFLREMCTKTGTQLILDEVQSGFGRTGRFFAHQHAGIEADIITMAKGMGNGFPVGGILIKPSIEAFAGMLGTTYGGNHLACAASLGVLEVLESEDLMEHARELGDYMIRELNDMEPVLEVRGKGLMIGVEFPFAIADLRKNLLYSHHIFTGSSSNPNTLRLLPPLTITKDEVDFFLNALGEQLIPQG